MNITLVIFSLSSGGAERVMSIVANYLVKHGHTVTLITIDALDRDFYPLDSRIKRVALDLKRDSRSLWASIKNNGIRVVKLRKAIRASNPNVVISFIDRMNVLTLIATKGLGLPVIVSEHIDPRQLPPGGIWNPLRRWTYSWSSAVIVLTSELREVVSEFVSQNKLHVIPNPALVTSDDNEAVTEPDFPKPYAVAMGRLVCQKGFDLLLNAFSQCKNKSWHLVILGEGPEREPLTSMAESLSLSDRVHFPGNFKNPNRVLKNAELFVLSSRFEGFPMALVEAMSCGLPVVSFDCPTGPSDIITNRHDGILVPAGDVLALVEAMDSMMEDDKKRLTLGQNAMRVTQTFSLEKVMEQWNDVIHAVTEREEIHAREKA